MSDNTIETIEHNGYTIRIEPDEFPSSPREDSNLGTMCFDHKRYSMPWEFDGVDQANPVYYENGSKWEPKRCQSWSDVLRAIRQAVQEAGDDIALALPVFMLDHSGTVYGVPNPIRDYGRLDPFRHLYMGMDSGQVGYIFITRSKVQEEYGWKKLTPERLAKLAEYLKTEVETYSDWANGSVYGYVIEDQAGEEVDSCWGFYGVSAAIEAGKEACPKEPAGV